jgi:hypothetical protein
LPQRRRASPFPSSQVQSSPSSLSLSRTARRAHRSEYLPPRRTFVAVLVCCVPLQGEASTLFTRSRDHPVLRAISLARKQEARHPRWCNTFHGQSPGDRPQAAGAFFCRRSGRRREGIQPAIAFTSLHESASSVPPWSALQPPKDGMTSPPIPRSVVRSEE